MNSIEFLFALVIAVVFFGLTHLSYGVLPLDLEVAQLIVFPLLIALFWWGRPLNIKVPRWVLAIACFGAAASSAYAYVFSLNQRGAVLFATLAEDALKNETRIFRIAVNDYGEHAALGVASIYDPLRSSAEAQQLLLENSRVEAVVWGSKRWINISFRQKPALPLGEITDATSFGALSQLYFVQSVPIIGLSYEPVNDTVAFLADLFEGLTYQSRHRSDVSQAREEIALYEAASRVAPWSNFAHRAYPWWQLGNRYLLASFPANGQTSSNLFCALRAYATAKSFLSADDNKELVAAIHNNHAIALYAQYLFFGRKELKKEARTHLKLAVRSLTQRNIFKVDPQASSIAAVNLGLLAGQDSVAKRRHRHSKRGKHSKKGKRRLEKRVKGERHARDNH